MLLATTQVESADRFLKIFSTKGVEKRRSTSAGERVPAHFSCDSDSATVGREQNAKACNEQKASVHGPLRLTRHVAARNDVDSLQKPDASHEQQ